VQFMLEEHLADIAYRVPYAALAKVFALIEATTKRLEKTSLLTAFFVLVIQRSAKGDTTSLLQAVYLCINRVRDRLRFVLTGRTDIGFQLSPDYIGIELGIGESLLVKAIAESTGRSIGVVKADLQAEGDLGKVAMVSECMPYPLFQEPHSVSSCFQNSKNSQKTLFKPKPLTLPFVFKNLKEIALSAGHSVRAIRMRPAI
jgi:DNA ligase-1